MIFKAQLSHFLPYILQAHSNGARSLNHQHVSAILWALLTHFPLHPITTWHADVFSQSLVGCWTLKMFIQKRCNHQPTFEPQSNLLIRSLSSLTHEAPHHHHHCQGYLEVGESPLDWKLLIFRPFPLVISSPLQSSSLFRIYQFKKNIWTRFSSMFDVTLFPLIDLHCLGMHFWRPCFDVYSFTL